jgi:hypothetical protein
LFVGVGIYQEYAELFVGEEGEERGGVGEEEGEEGRETEAATGVKEEENGGEQAVVGGG